MISFLSRYEDTKELIIYFPPPPLGNRVEKKYSGVPVFRTFKGNENWFEESVVIGSSSYREVGKIEGSRNLLYLAVS